MMKLIDRDGCHRSPLRPDEGDEGVVLFADMDGEVLAQRLSAVTIGPREPAGEVLHGQSVEELMEWHGCLLVRGSVLEEVPLDLCRQGHLKVGDE